MNHIFIHNLILQLGFNIRGGAEHKCGIFLSKVMPNTEVERLGLREGDQLLKVNGTSFENIEHAEAVRILKENTEVTMNVRYFPYGYKKTYERVGAIYGTAANPDAKIATSLYGTVMFGTAANHDTKIGISVSGTTGHPDHTMESSYYGTTTNPVPELGPALYGTVSQTGHREISSSFGNHPSTTEMNQNSSSYNVTLVSANNSIADRNSLHMNTFTNNRNVTDSFQYESTRSPDQIVNNDLHGLTEQSTSGSDKFQYNTTDLRTGSLYGTPQQKILETATSHQFSMIPEASTNSCSLYGLRGGKAIRQGRPRPVVSPNSHDFMEEQSLYGTDLTVPDVLAGTDSRIY